MGRTLLRPGSSVALGRRRVVLPRDTEAVELSFRADHGIVLGLIPRANGTSPPALAWSGVGLTLTSVIGPHLQIDSVAGGTGLGQATFKASSDNGTTFFATGIPTAASVALTGSLTGITAAFPAGPYNVDNFWQPTVASWKDMIRGYVVSQATAAQQPLYIAKSTTLGNRPCVRGTAAASWSLDNTTDTPFVQSAARTAFLVVRSTDGTGGTLIDFKRGNPDFCLMWYEVGVRVAFSSNASNVLLSSPPAILNTSYYFTHVVGGTGAQLGVRGNGAAIATDGTALPAESAGAGFTIGRRNAIGQSFTGDIAEITVSRGALGNLAKPESHNKALYAL